MYVLTDNNFFIGTDFRGKPTTVLSKEKAVTFKTEMAAENYLRNVPGNVKIYNWHIAALEENEDGIFEIKKFKNTTKTTTLEDEDFDIFEFFSGVIQVMSQLERFIANMVSNEEITDFKILDIRHYIRNNDHKLNAIQMQRLGYYLRDLEKERYEYKSKRLIASMFVNSIEALKNKDNIDKMNDVLASRYNPRVLNDNDIEYIINKKKDEDTYVAQLNIC